MLRTIALSLILVLSVGIMLPFTNSAHGVRQSVQIGQKRHHRQRSKAWWRRYRARLRQKRAAAALAHRQKLLGLPQNLIVGDLSTVSGPTAPALPQTSAVTETLPPPAMVAVSATSVSAPAVEAPAVAAPATANGATRPRVVNSAHPAFTPTAPKAPGQMNLAVVALARPNPAFLTSREEKKMLGGVAVSELRRIVIDKMVATNGWVINDFVREVNGHRLFIVTGRTPKDALTPEKAWTFYFTEAGGRIYALTTDAPVEHAERMTVEAERFIESLRKRAQ